jgi:hypothetical protein
MSGEDEGFLGRWSRRKQEVQGEVKQQQEVAALPPEQQKLPTAEAETKKEEPEFDVSTLPPIESIVAGTDIRAFLSKGVPAALTQAALRRAWSADPAIRDYIGLSENSWDFNALDGQHGFAPLSPNTDIKGMLSEIFGEVREGAEKIEKMAADMAPETPPIEVAESPVRLSDSPLDKMSVSEPSEHAVDTAEEKPDGDKNARSEVAAQTTNEPEGDLSALPPRRHGSALPS